MKSNKVLALAVAYLFTSGLVLAKLPPLTDEQKAAAEIAKTKAADVAKKEAELLAKSQDSVVSRYLQELKAKGVTVKPTPIAVAPTAPVAAPVKKTK